jgi:hypothetical protein
MTDGWKHIDTPEHFEVTVSVRKQVDRLKEEMSEEEAERKVYKMEVESYYFCESLWKIHSNEGGFEKHIARIRRFHDCEWLSLDMIPLTGFAVDFLDFTEREGSYSGLKEYLKVLKEVGGEEEAEKLIEEMKWPFVQPSVEDILRARICPDCGRIFKNWRGMRTHQGQKHKSFLDKMIGGSGK